MSYPLTQCYLEITVTEMAREEDVSRQTNMLKNWSNCTKLARLKIEISMGDLFASARTPEPVRKIHLSTGQ